MLEAFAGVSDLRPFRVDGPVRMDDGWWWAWQLVWAETESAAYSGFWANCLPDMPYYEQVRSRTVLLEGPFNSQVDARRGRKALPLRKKRGDRLVRSEPDLRMTQAHEVSALEALALIEP